MISNVLFIMMNEQIIYDDNNALFIMRNK